MQPLAVTIDYAKVERMNRLHREQHEPRSIGAHFLDLELLAVLLWAWLLVLWAW